MDSKWSITCREKRKCFLQHKRPSGINGCPILTSGYPSGFCPFAKAHEDDIAYMTLELRESRKKLSERGNEVQTC